MRGYDEAPTGRSVGPNASDVRLTICLVAFAIDRARARSQRWAGDHVPAYGGATPVSLRCEEARTGSQAPCTNASYRVSRDTHADDGAGIDDADAGQRRLNRGRRRRR